MDWYRSLPEYRRKIYLLLIVAILLTLPCYCIGLALLAFAPEEPIPPSAAPAGSGFWSNSPSICAAVTVPGPALEGSTAGPGPGSGCAASQLRMSP